MPLTFTTSGDRPQRVCSPSLSYLRLRDQIRGSAILNRKVMAASRCKYSELPPFLLPEDFLFSFPQPAMNHSLDTTQKHVEKMG